MAVFVNSLRFLHTHADTTVLANPRDEAITTFGSAAYSCAIWEGVQAACISSSTVQTYSHPKVRFSTTPGREPEVEVALA